MRTYVSRTVLLVLACVCFMNVALAGSSKYYTEGWRGRTYTISYKSHDGKDGVVWLKLRNTSNHKMRYRWTIEVEFYDRSTKIENFTNKLRAGSDHEVWVGTLGTRKVKTFRLTKMRIKNLDKKH